MELMVSIGIISFLSLIVLSGIDPLSYFAQSKNALRTQDVATIADAFAQYNEEEGNALLLSIPLSPSNPIEICADARTGSCSGLLDVSDLVRKRYLRTVPIDPLLDPDESGSHSRYFIHRPSERRFTVSAPDTQLDLAIISITR
jgi:type II secretory pathway pseudopilin PulG